MIVAAADGSSLSNPGPAGWAWYVDEGRWASGGWPHGTNNMGELMAVLDLLHATASFADESLHILCDSQYVINSVTKWMPGWKRNGWIKKDKKPVLNREFLQGIDEAMQGRDITFEWVKGHAGHPMNEAADTRARAAATAFQQGGKPDSGPGYVGEGEAAVSREVGRDDDPWNLEGQSRQESFLLAPSPTAPAIADQPDLFAEPTGSGPDSDEVIRREKSLLTDAVRADPAALRALLHPDFVEYSASGRIWTRNRLLAQIAPLERRVTFESMGQVKLAPDAILLRWKATDTAGSALRSSVWVRDATTGKSQWRLLFTQGTPVPKN